MSMSNHPLNVLRLQSVEHVPEVFTVRGMATRELVRQICHELRVVFEVLEQGFDSEFWVPGHADEANILEFEKLLFVSKHALEEVFVHHHVWREVQLH